MRTVIKRKGCINCSQRKRLSEFSQNKATRDGLNSRCKTCDNAVRDEYRGQVRTVSSKFCPSCRKTKDADNFNNNKRQADGLQTKCRKCEQDWRAANKETRAATMRSWQQRNQKCIEPGCDVLVYGTGHMRCENHRAEAERAREAAAQDRAALAGRERQEKYAGRICEECGGEIPAEIKLDAKYCDKACRDAVNKRRQHADYEANRAAYLEQDRVYRLANPRQGTLAAARQRAARLGVPFELAEDDLPAELGDCVICDRKLVTGTRKVTPSSPTIDRIRPELGYVPGNVLAWVCFSCNARKHNRTLDDLADGAAGEHWRAWATPYLGSDDTTTGQFL